MENRKFGKLENPKFGKLEIRKFEKSKGKLDIENLGNLENQKFGNSVSWKTGKLEVGKLEFGKLENRTPLDYNHVKGFEPRCVHSEFDSQRLGSNPCVPIRLQSCQRTFPMKNETRFNCPPRDSFQLRTISE